MSRPRADRTPVVLASGSAIRAAILKGAGVPFTLARPDVDEDVLKREAERTGMALPELAMRLAEAKACAPPAPPEALVIGADQILEFEGRRYGKPKSMDEARARLLMLQGRPHRLLNAVAVARAGAVVWRRFEAPTLFMRALTGADIDAYLAEAGPDILASVGAYQVEGLGGRLFEAIDGDYFAVLGLSLHPLVGFLKAEGALAW